MKFSLAMFRPFSRILKVFDEKGMNFETLKSQNVLIFREISNVILNIQLEIFESVNVA